jgi:hypothetical protein
MFHWKCTQFEVNMSVSEIPVCLSILNNLICPWFKIGWSLCCSSPLCMCNWWRCAVTSVLPYVSEFPCATVTFYYGCGQYGLIMPPWCPTVKQWRPSYRVSIAKTPKLTFLTVTLMVPRRNCTSQRKQWCSTTANNILQAYYASLVSPCATTISQL